MPQADLRAEWPGKQRHASTVEPRQRGGVPHTFLSSSGVGLRAPLARGNMCDMTEAENRDSVVAELRSELAREQGKLRALQDIGQALGNTLDVEELVSLLLTRVSRIMDTERTALFVVDETSGDLWTRLTHAGSDLEIRLKPGQGLAGWAAKWGRSVNVKD